MENERLNNYYKELPPHFREDYCIDATKGRIGIYLNLIAIGIAIVVGAAVYIPIYGFRPFNNEDIKPLYAAIAVWIWALGLCVYLIVHELTHGICYKLLTKQKLKFGLTLTVAYCGLKEGYVNKKTALIAVLAPFVVHSIWMIIAIILITEPIISIAVIMLFALHFGGCCGDLWVAFLLIFKYRKQQVLMCDDGPKQQFFVYDENAPEYPQAEAAQNSNASLFGSSYIAEEQTSEEQPEPPEDNCQS